MIKNKFFRGGLKKKMNVLNSSMAPNYIGHPSHSIVAE